MKDCITVAELKEKLKNMPDDAYVVTRQYRHGQDTVTCRFLTKYEHIVVDEIWVNNTGSVNTVIL